MERGGSQADQTAQMNSPFSPFSYSFRLPNSPTHDALTEQLVQINSALTEAFAALPSEDRLQIDVEDSIRPVHSTNQQSLPWNLTSPVVLASAGYPIHPSLC